MITQLKYSELEQFLRNLGFEGRRVKGSHVFFEHAGSGAEVALKDYKPDEIMEPSDLVVVRGTLDGFGVLDRDDFDRRLRNDYVVNSK